MNKLISNINGGYPFVLDDLRFMDDANRDAFRGMLYFLEQFNGRDGIVLHKKTDTFTGGTTIPDTYVFYKGEIYKIPSQQLATSGGFTQGYVVTFPTSYQSGGAGTKTFQDGNTHETYQIREATITKQAVQQGDVIAFSWTSQGWIANTNFSYREIMKRYMGIDTIESNVATNTTNIDTNTSNINVNTSDINQINLGTFSALTYNLPNICKFTSADGSASKRNNHAWDGQSQSWLKATRINENLIVIDFNIEDIQSPSYNDHGENFGGFLMRNLGSAFYNLPEFEHLTDVYGVCEARCLSHSACISGHAEVVKDPSSDDGLIVMVQNPSGLNSITALNRGYTINGSTGSATATSDLDFRPRWRFRGQITVGFYGIPNQIPQGGGGL